MSGFTNRQQKFIDAYVLSGNAAKAAITAGYSAASARQQGHRLLTNADIAAEVSRRLAESALSAEETLWRLSRQARADLADFLSGDGDDLHVDLDKAAGMTDLIKTLTVNRVTRHTATGEPITTATVRIELHDSQAALRDLARAHGLFRDGIELSGSIDVRQYDDAAREVMERINGMAAMYAADHSL